MRADSSKAPEVQAMLKQLGDEWQSTQTTLAAKQEQYDGIVSLWQQYNDSKQGVGRVLEDVDPVISQSSPCDSQEEVKKALDKHKVKMAWILLDQDFNWTKISRFILPNESAEISQGVSVLLIYVCGWMSS